MDDRTYNRLFGETVSERRNRHNGFIVGSCETCKMGFTSKRLQRGHVCLKVEHDAPKA